MKKFCFVITALFLSLTLSAYDITPLKFLGIPVDGPKSAMISALKAKGFEYVPGTGTSSDILVGTFNGVPSAVTISTNRDKVDRVMVFQTTSDDEAQIKIKFNNLLSQFRTKEKYVEIGNNKYIDEDENISYKIHVEKKIYQAHFALSSDFSLDEMSMLKDITAGKITNVKAVNEAYLRAQAEAKTMVWFQISEYEGGYIIAIFYDNLRNRPNGEDL